MKLSDPPDRLTQYKNLARVLTMGAVAGLLVLTGSRSASACTCAPPDRYDAISQAPSIFFGSLTVRIGNPDLETAGGAAGGAAYLDRVAEVTLDPPFYVEEEQLLALAGQGGITVVDVATLDEVRAFDTTSLEAAGYRLLECTDPERRSILVAVETIDEAGNPAGSILDAGRLDHPIVSGRYQQIASAFDGWVAIGGEGVVGTVLKGIAGVFDGLISFGQANTR